MIHIGWRTRDRDDDTGHFNCPSCRCRKPAAAGARVTQATIFFIPVGGGDEHYHYYRCDGCQNQFDQDDGYGYDFGEHTTLRRWDCRACGADNPITTYRCPLCGADA